MWIILCVPPPVPNDYEVTMQFITPYQTKALVAGWIAWGGYAFYLASGMTWNIDAFWIAAGA